MRKLNQRPSKRGNNVKKEKKLKRDEPYVITPLHLVWNGDYYYMIGGGVHLGETSEACIEREILEEAGINASVHHLAVVCENFFKGIGGKIDGFDCHTIEFYFYMNILDDNVSLWKNMTDEGEELVWLPIEKIEENKIKPEFIKYNIKTIIHGEQTLHVIEDRDR